MVPTPAISARVPAPLTPLVGRDGRVESAWQALQGTRLLTLTGSGGSGKTRLAVELASRVEGAAWVELASLGEPRFLAEHVASVLSVVDRSGRPSIGQIVERFGSHELLLVLDNCEHVVTAVTPLVAQLLRECPRMKVLATSREALGVTGERTLAVAPLSLPKNASLDAAREADAIALFVERAQDVRANFVLTDRNAPAITRICRRLDGIPLAIELAAARVRALDPEQLADRLESSIGLLETGSKAAQPRHRTIRDTLEWSYRLLTDEERTLLRRLSVFHGTFSLDAVEDVCRGCGEAATLDLVTGLLDKSLLLYEPGDAGARYRLLETLRDYAGEKLAEAGETDAIRERHARFFVALAERAAPAIFGGGGDEAWISRLDEEFPNFRDVHDWCEQQTSRLELSLRLSVALHWHWYARGRFNEGRMRVGIALTFAEQAPPLLRGRALTVLGHLAIWQGDYGGVHAPMDEAVRLLRPLGDSSSLAYALHGVGIAAGLQGRVAEGRRLTDEAAGKIGDASTPLAAWIEYWRGLLAEWDNDPAAARHAYEQTLRIGRQLGHRPAIGHALCLLGRLSAAAGDVAVAASALDESVAIFRDTDDRWGLAQVLLGLARVAAVSARSERAALLLGAADALRAELSIELSPHDRDYRDATIAAALQHIGEPAFWSAWARGNRGSLADAIAIATATQGASESAGPAGAPADAIDLRIRALGAFETLVRNRRIGKSEWGSSRARELLAFLACHPEGCTKAQIGLALWPDASPGQLRNTFHVTLHRLRHALVLPDAIQADGDRYRLNPSLTREFDAQLFEHEARSAARELRRGADATTALAAAVARYRGDFLAGESVGEWAEERRDRLQQLHLTSLDLLGRAQVDHGRHAEAAEAFRALLAADPVNEEACRRYMLCLTTLGDRAAALRAYDALARALRNELGVRPERETTALRDKLSNTTSA